MKDFLYLVQARARLAEKHLSLASDRADVLIYTFDKKIDKPNFLYKSNTTTYEGKNILFEAARKLNKSHKYYVLLEDDIVFTKGSFKEFEDEVIRINPDLCIPVYREKRAIRYLSNLSPFRYSVLVDWDCCFVCMTKELFFSNKFLPYSLEVNGISCKRNYYPSWRFWFGVFENYSDRKLLVANRIHIKNKLSERSWPDESLCYPDLLAQLTDGRKPKMAQSMPCLFFIERASFHTRKRVRNLRKALKQNNYQGLAKVQHIVILLGASLRYFFVRNFGLKFVLIYATVYGLAKDVRLNWGLHQERKGGA